MAKVKMGIGVLGFKNVVFKRQFRWTFEVINICGNPDKRVPTAFVKVAGRPKINMDELELNFLHGKTWKPGKATFEPITVSYIDAVQTSNADLTRHLYDWIASVYEFNDHVQQRMGEKRHDFSATGILKILDGCGKVMERWILGGMWPVSVNFGDLDYASSDVLSIELSLRYDRIKYTSFCPEFTPKNCCSPCAETDTLEAPYG